MKLILSALLAIAWSGMAFGENCNFDQQAVAKELQRVASLNPGARPVAGQPAVEWRNQPGHTIRLALGGCNELGVEVAIRAESDSAGPSLENLLAAVERYWDADAARAARKQIESGGAIEQLEEAGTILQLPSSDAFPFGAIIRFDVGRFSISWTLA